MKEGKDIKTLLKKFVLNQCSEDEIKEVVEYFRNRTDSTGFLSVEEVMGMIDDIPSMDEASSDRIYQEIMEASKHKARKSQIKLGRPVFWRYAAAIAVICVIAGGYFVRQNWLSTTQSVKISQIDNQLTPLEEVITLERENGEFEIIHPDGSRKVTDAHGNVIGEQNKGVLTYGGDEVTEKLVYNTLTVPYGKRFEVVLSDGTSVHLNAGTSLKYPVKFLKSEEIREVFVTGEAYFEVTHDVSHPFIVNTGELAIRVLGTRFNVSTYPEDETTDVVLVEGSVALQQGNAQLDLQSEFLLEPGEKGEFDKKNRRISKRNVATSIYTAWINGELVFRNMAFEDILGKLERHYNISIVNQNETMAKEKFNASFGDEPVEKVLDYLKTIYGIQFTIENNKVIVL